MRLFWLQPNLLVHKPDTYTLCLLLLHMPFMIRQQDRRCNVRCHATTYKQKCHKSKIKIKHTGNLKKANF